MNSEEPLTSKENANGGSDVVSEDQLNAEMNQGDEIKQESTSLHQDSSEENKTDNSDSSDSADN